MQRKATGFANAARGDLQHSKVKLGHSDIQQQVRIHSLS